MLPHNMPRKAKIRVVGTYLNECDRLAGERANSAKNTFVVIGGNFGGLDTVRCSAIVDKHRVLQEAYVVSECDGLYALCSTEGFENPCLSHGDGNVRTLVSTFSVASPSQHADPLHHHSAAQPVLPPTQAALAASPSQYTGNTPKPPPTPPPLHLMLVDNTPLFDEFMSTIEDADGAQDFLDHIGRFCFSSDLCHVQTDGTRLPTPMPLARKLEDLFTIALDRRRIMARASRWKPSDFETRCATEEEMKAMMNEWRHNVDRWMHRKSLEEYHTRSDKHDFVKKRFSAYQFHIAGCKFLLSKLIEYPIIAQPETSRSGPGSTAQPAGTVRRLLDSYENHKDTAVYKSAVEASKRKSAENMRLSQQIWRIAGEVGQGIRIRRKLENGDINDDDLDGAQQELINRLDENEETLQQLRKQQLPVYGGAWAHVQC